MYTRQFMAFFRASLIHFTRNKIALVFSTLLPLAFVAVYGAIFVSSGPARFSIGVVDGRAGAAELYARVSEVPGVQPVLVAADGVDRAVRRRQVIAALEAGSAGDGVGEIRALPDNRDVSLLIARALRVPADGDGVRFREVEPTNTVFAYLPGLLVLALLNLALFGTGAKLLADRASGALKLFHLSPASPLVMYGADLCSRLLLAIVQIAVFLGIARFVYGIAIGPGAACATLGFGTFGALVLLSIGYALGGVLRSQSRGVHVFTLTNLFLQFFGDVLFPASYFPLMHAVAAYLPTSYLVDGLRQLMLGLPSATGLALDAGVLALWGSAAVLLIRARFSFEADA